MKRFDALLEDEVAGYEGEFGPIIRLAPAFYRMMTRLLGDRELPRRMSPLVIAAIAYFILPADIIPEEKLGAAGYVDDIYLCAFVANEVMQAAGSQEIVTRNWDGETSVVALIRDILGRESDLIGSKRGQIMRYIGYDQLERL